MSDPSQAIMVVAIVAAGAVSVTSIASVWRKRVETEAACLSSSPRRRLPIFAESSSRGLYRRRLHGGATTHSKSTTPTATSYSSLVLTEHAEHSCAPSLRAETD